LPKRDFVTTKLDYCTVVQHCTPECSDVEVLLSSSVNDSTWAIQREKNAVAKRGRISPENRRKGKPNEFENPSKFDAPRPQTDQTIDNA
jgi:hypothetical protein